MARNMTVDELAKRVTDREDTFILDVRNTDEFNDWKIEGDSIEIMNVPYFELLDGVAYLEEKMDKHQEIIVVCARGGSSQMVADMMEDTGFSRVYSLAGGMEAWSEHLEPVKIVDLRNGGALYQFVRLGKGCLSYMVISGESATVIDASRMTDVYKQFADAKNASIEHTIDTHLHADHISGGRNLADETGGTYHLPPEDAKEVTFAFNPLEEGHDIEVGNSSIEVRPFYSPGHTIGSTSLILDDEYVLTGDTLFVESIGRPDLAGKADDWVGDLYETLYSRYKVLSDDLIVLPGHYSLPEEMDGKGAVQARLGDIYERNAGLHVEDADAFRAMVTENLPPEPNAHQQVRETNMGIRHPDESEKREMEIGPNRCAVHS